MSQGSEKPGGNLKDWQFRIFSTVWITYFAYYLCRYNMSMAKTPLCDTFGWNEGDFGWILSSLTIMYAVGQFVNGQLADRFGTRLIASLGAAVSVLMNLAIFAVVMVSADNGLSSKIVWWLLVLFWGINGFFQAMGWSPMVRVMTHWFPVEGRGNIMGWLGTCYQVGGAFSWFLAFFLVQYYPEHFGGNWRMVFLVPAILFAIVGVVFFLMIRNTPEDVGLPPVEADDHTEEGMAGKKPRSIIHNVMRTLENPYLWIVAITFFLLDVNRYGFVNWLPAYLDTKQIEIDTGGFPFKEVIKRCIHPLAGGLGTIAAGWATDRFFKGRRAPVIAILLLLLGLFSIAFTHLDHSNTTLVIIVIALIGFCTYGPHILMVGHAAQDFGKKSGSAGAAGFIDCVGYIGASLAGVGAGKLIKAYGYEVNFVVFGCAALLGAALICVIWKVGPRTHPAK